MEVVSYNSYFYEESSTLFLNTRLNNVEDILNIGLCYGTKKSEMK